MMDDIDIIQAVKSGDTDAYALLVERYHRSLLSFIYRIVGDRNVVEDIGQDVFLAAYRSIATFDENRGVPFSAWIFTMARNRSLTVLRERQTENRRETMDMADFGCGRKTPEEELLNRERQEAIAACLRQIPQPFRKTILSSLDGNSLEEIARCHGVTLGTVKSRLHRAREKLRQLVGLYFDYCGIIKERK